MIVKLTKTAPDSRCRPDGVESATDVMTTVEALVAFSAAAMDFTSVAFCVCPTLDAVRPPMVRTDAMVVSCTLRKPGGFTVQDVEPAEGAEVPGAQASQDCVAVLANVPLRHTVHVEALAPATLPGAQGEQVVAATAEYVPGWQATQKSLAAA